MDIPKELFVRSGTVQIDVCDNDGCEMATEELGRYKTPVGRGADALWAELGRTFSPGSVAVTVELRDENDILVAAHREEIELARTWPNGKACDGEGFVSGHLSLGEADAV